MLKFPFRTNAHFPISRRFTPFAFANRGKPFLKMLTCFIGQPHNLFGMSLNVYGIMAVGVSKSFLFVTAQASTGKDALPFAATWSNPFTASCARVTKSKWKNTDANKPNMWPTKKIPMPSNHRNRLYERFSFRPIAVLRRSIKC